MYSSLSAQTEENATTSLLESEMARRFPEHQMFYKKPIDDISAYRGKEGDAGYDMYLTKDMWILPFIVRKFPLNIMLEIPKKHFGLITGRSGMSSDGNIVVPGIIDNTFRGQIMAQMYRVGLLPKKLKRGTRICQLIIQPYVEPRMICTGVLSQTDRGSNGFGSSGDR